MLKHSLALAALAAASLSAQIARADDRVTPGDASVEPPTLISLGVDWPIEGDDNRNASVGVEYRRSGESTWRRALPLLRLQNEQVNGRVGGPSFVDATNAAESAAVLARANPAVAAANAANTGGPFAFSPFSYIAPNMFSGSVFDLMPDTDYELRLTLADPDGVVGVAQRTLRAHTRAEPQPAAGGKTYHVYPVGYAGPKQEPAFIGLMAAYYMAAAHFDYQNAYPPRVQPGDTILVHAGVYLSDRHHYMNRAPAPGYLALATVFDGTYYLTQSGTAERPIAIKAAGDGEVIFDGDGAENLFNLLSANYHYFEGITVRNTNVAFLLGIKGIAGASGFTLKRSRIENVGRGVHDDWSGSKNFYIADNMFIGRHDPDKMMGWNGAIWEKLPGYPERLDSEYAIKVYGQGHVVARNTIANWHDGVDFATYGNPDGTPNPLADRFPMSVDFYENDITNMGDNCIETDGGGRNMRVFRNRCANSSLQGLSAQPIFGGPVYFIRNVVYNGPGAGSLKFVSTPSGILVYQNTFVGEVAVPGPAANEHFRNNLILAQGAAGPVFTVGTFTNYSSSDYNGFAPNAGAAVSFQWASPPFEKRADYAAALIARDFKTLAEYQKTTEQDLHSRLVDYGVFVNVPKPDMKDPQRIYDVRALDFGLRKRSPAIDAGTPLPNITDGFTGRAPELGALELGRPAPHYGPAPATGAGAAHEATEWKDPSPHTVHFISVQPGVQLEVLDWGGSGRPLVLLTGYGNSAHVFDDFATKLTRDYHVYGITRRGFGVSSMPTERFGPDRLGDDVLAVLDALLIERPVLAGHSIAGMELSSIGTRRPERVAGLIYLDAGYLYAFDNGRAAPDPDEPNVEGPKTPNPTPADVASFAALRAWTERVYGYAFPEAEVRATMEPRADGRPGAPRSSAGVEAMFSGFQKYEAIRAPILAIFTVPHLGPEVSDSKDPEVRARAEAWTKAGLKIWSRQVHAFTEGLPEARVVQLANSTHYLFITSESDVLREMRAFIATLR